MKYLILDKNNDVVETLTTQELKKRLGSNKNIKQVLLLEVLLENKFHIVEDSIEFNADLYKFICSSKRNKYYATYYGDFYSVSKKTNKKRKLSIQGKASQACVQIDNRKVYVARMLAKLFLKDFSEEKIVRVIDPKKKIDVSNIKVVDKDDYIKEIQEEIHEGKKVGVFEDGKCIQQFESVTKAAKECGYAREHLSYLLNNRSNQRIKFI